VHAPVTVVVDAAPRAGLGHLSRGGAVAVALGCRGIETRCYAYGAEVLFVRDGVNWEPLSGDLPYVPDGVLVVDSYRLDSQTLAAARDVSLVVMHDYGDPPEGAALVVAVAGESSGRPPTRLVGPTYAALRPAFWGLPQRETRPTVERILVATGSGQLDELGCELAEALGNALPAAEVTLVRGPDVQGPAPAGVETLDAPESLFEPLLQVDLAVTAGGQTMLEAAATGTPCVALPLVDNQRPQVAMLARAGAIWPVDTPDEAVGAARELIDDGAGRQRLGAASQRTVDGYGALRIAFEIARLEDQRS
jgi:UDP-2,4-diacetamido-2,4,6-trideoxy-beta-L-altropyranose hydrolase